jgi:O-Antigen ligase
VNFHRDRRVVATAVPLPLSRPLPQKDYRFTNCTKRSAFVHSFRDSNGLIRERIGSRSYALTVARRQDASSSDRAFLRTAADPAVIPAVLAFALFVLFAAKDAGYSPTVWYPGTLFLLGLLVVAVVARPGALAAAPPAGRASVFLLAALTGWTYLSILWSDVKGDAWDGANRGLLYLVVYALFVSVSWRAESVALVLAAFAVAIAGLGLGELIGASRSANPDSYFLLARFSEPTGYQNANCALFSIALWPALFLGARRQVPVLLRAVMLAAATVLVELAVLSQSRGWLGAMPIVFLLYVALVPGRVRGLTFALPVAAALLATRPTLLDVFPALHSGVGIHRALASARDAVAISAVAVFVVGAVLALVDRRLWPGGTRGRVLAQAGAAVFGAAAVAGAVVGLIWLGNPETRARTAWDEFTAKPAPLPTGSYFGSGFGSNRHDIWRVAVDEIRDEPVAGVGADNFAVDYLRERHSSEEPLYPHSLELRILAQTGVVGGLLFAGFLLSAVLAWARRGPEPDFVRGLRAASLVGFAYWFVHGSIDWFWELPGLAAPAFAMLGFAVATAAPSGPPTRTRARASRSVLAGLVALAAVISLVPPWLAAKEVQAAAHGWRKSPTKAFDRLDRARRLNPLSDQPDLISGAIASRLGQASAMAAAFTRAIERNPKNWYAHLELGVAYANAAHRADALAELRMARLLDPREPTIPAVIRRVRAGRHVSTAALDEIFLRRTFVSNRSRRT